MLVTTAAGIQSLDLKLPYTMGAAIKKKERKKKKKNDEVEHENFEFCLLIKYDLKQFHVL